MNKGIRAKVKRRETFINVIISPQFNGRVRVLKIYYPKFIMVGILCFILCGIYLTGMYIKNIMQENCALKSNIAQLHDLNYAELKIINEKTQEIDNIKLKNLYMQQKIDQLVSIYHKIARKYKEITETYILAESGTLVSRDDSRRDRDFINDITEFRDVLINLKSILLGNTQYDDTLLEAQRLLEDYMESLPDFTPIQGRITDEFGDRIDPFTKRQQFHSGIDIAGPYGNDIKAAAKGKVVFAGRRGAYGNLVIIDHGYGITTFYGHASKLMVQEGQEVEEGQVIAKVGSTGRSTGPHLHFEIRINDVPVDPLKYITIE